MKAVRSILAGIGCAILMFFGALILVSALLMVWPKKAHGQTPHWSDRDSIATAVYRANPRASIAAALAIAWEESGGNDSMPGLRGHHCWWSVKESQGIPSSAVGYRLDLRRLHLTTDKHGVLWLSYRDPNCEVGRFQIKPSTARLRCPGWNVFTYGGNLQCFAIMFGADTDAGGTLYAIRRQNGKGGAADAYLRRVLATIGWMTITGDSAL